MIAALLAARTFLTTFLGTPLGRWTLVVLLILASLFAGGWHERNVGWNERDLQAQKEDSERAAEIARQVTRAHTIETAQSKAFQDLTAEHDKEKARADQAVTDRLAAIRGGARLRANCSSSPDVPSTANSTPGSDGSPKAGFLGEADSAFLVGEAARADEVVRELQLCQATLTQERK
jgi:Bacteriophage Rz lysis protein